MDYVKVWMKTNDRGGLMHVSLDTFRCFKAIEMVTYDLIKKGCTKEEVMSQVTENVRFHWMLICDLHDEAKFFELLQDVIEVWFTIRGSPLLESYLKIIRKQLKVMFVVKRGYGKNYINLVI